MTVRLHRQYGLGLSKLAANMKGLRTSSPNPDSDPSANGAEGDLITINSFDIHPYDMKSLPLGMVAGLQYNTDTFGKCFYAMVDTVNFVDIFKADLEALMEDMNFYTLIAYDPIRFASNIAALSE